MVDNSLRTHPLIVIAATAVILTCLLAIGVMTGIVPSPLARERSASLAAPATAPAVRDNAASRNAYAPSVPTARAPDTTGQRAAAPAAAGSTSGTAPEQTLAGSAPASAPCTNCGSVTSVRTVRQQGEAGMIGPAAGGLVGGVLGHQIGNGRGNTLATVLGAGVGAAAGTEIERRHKSTTHYVVAVQMGDGNVRHFNYASAPAFQTGDRVRVAEGRLVRE